MSRGSGIPVTKFQCLNLYTLYCKMYNVKQAKIKCTICTKNGKFKLHNYFFCIREISKVTKNLVCYEWDNIKNSFLIHGTKKLRGHILTIFYLCPVAAKMTFLAKQLFYQISNYNFGIVMKY